MEQEIIYTLEGLRNGKVACENDGTIEQLKKVLNKAFPEDDYDIENWVKQYPIDNYYLVEFANKTCWTSSSEVYIPTQSVKVFLKEIEQKDPLEETPFHKPDFSHLREKIEKGVDIRFESKSVNDLKLESLKRNQQETLFSVYLSLGKVRIIYIDQTEEDVRTHQKNNPNWHIIVVKQEQDKGIQIVIKE